MSTEAEIKRRKCSFLLWKESNHKQTYLIKTPFNITSRQSAENKIACISFQTASPAKYCWEKEPWIQMSNVRNVRRAQNPSVWGFLLSKTVPEVTAATLLFIWMSLNVARPQTNWKGSTVSVFANIRYSCLLLFLVFCDTLVLLAPE